MLTKQGSGKFLTREYAKLLEKADRDRTLLTDEEIAWLELPDSMGLGEHDPDRFRIETSPVDHRVGAAPRTRIIDIRERPECGDGDD